MAAPENPLRRYDEALRAALPGLLCAVGTLLFGYGMGVVFGLNEDLIKSRLSDAAVAVSATVYHGDQAAVKSVLDKSWVYMQRAHLHAGGLGASALGLTLLVVLLQTSLLVVLLQTSLWRTRLISLGLGAGGLGYSIFWLLAGFRAPSLGSTGAAKESLAWLAIPASGSVVIATVAVAVLVVTTMARRR
jgi:hypothetical protein